MEEYLEEEAKIPIAAMKLNQDIKYFNESIDDSFTAIRYTVYGGLMFITIEPPNTFYY